jgi:hypothetical protein
MMRPELSEFRALSEKGRAVRQRQVGRGWNFSRTDPSVEPAQGELREVLALKLNEEVWNIDPTCARNCGP